jgi:hypothetical protein
MTGGCQVDAYRERLLVPVSYWLLSVPVVLVLGAEAYFFVDGWIPPLVIGLLAVLVGTFLVHWSVATIEVTGTVPVLRADKDTLALSEAGEVIALDEKQSTQLRGPRADPAAHLLIRPYLRRAVYVAIADPADGGAPYWLIATRHPERLAAAISAARDATGARTGTGGTGTGGTGTGGAGTGSAETDEAGTGSHQPAGQPSVG